MSFEIEEYQRFLRLQRDGAARLASDPLLRVVPVIVQAVGDIEQEVLSALGALNTNAEQKAGACIMVLMPDFDVTNPNASGVQGEIVLTARCMAMPMINDDPTQGIGLDAGVMALRVARVWGNWSDYGVAKVVQAKGQAIEAYTRDHTKGITGFDVTVRAPSGVAGGDKAITPTIAGAADAVTLDCATAGTSIYFTTDGSYPGSGNAAAMLYTVPFAVTAGTRVRAGAQTEAGVPSDPQFRDY